MATIEEDSQERYLENTPDYLYAVRIVPDFDMVIVLGYSRTGRYTKTKTRNIWVFENGICTEHRQLREKEGGLRQNCERIFREKWPHHEPNFTVKAWTLGEVTGLLVHKKFLAVLNVYRNVRFCFRDRSKDIMRFVDCNGSYREGKQVSRDMDLRRIMSANATNFNFYWPKPEEDPLKGKTVYRLGVTKCSSFKSSITFNGCKFNRGLYGKVNYSDAEPERVAL